jgi:uncharacterized protein (TIGR00725 family)
VTTSVVAVIGASQTPPEDTDYQDGLRLGRLLAAAGYAVATGGYGGLMEAVSAGAAEAGGRVIGVTAPSVFPARTGANRYVSEERPAAGVSDRIRELVEAADAVVALPGSIGTFAELIMAWNLAFVAPFSGQRPKPIVTMGAAWAELVPLLAERLETDGDLVQFVTTPEEAARAVIEGLGASKSD